MVGCWLVVRFVGHKFPKTKGRVAPCTCSHLFQIKWDYWECICLISPSVRRSVRRSLCSKKSGYLNLHRSFRRFNFPMRPAAVLWSVGRLEAGWLVVQSVCHNFLRDGKSMLLSEHLLSRSKGLLIRLRAWLEEPTTRSTSTHQSGKCDQQHYDNYNSTN